MRQQIISAAKVAVVIPSLYPGESLLRLLESLEEQSHHPHKVVIVDQSESLASRDLLRDYRGSLKELVEIIASEPGLSKARNVGLLSLGSDWDIALLPDDDVWFETDVIPAVVAAVEAGASAGSGRLYAEGVAGPSRLRFPDDGQTITPKNVWRTSIEACYFITPNFLDSVGLYSESLGLGAKSPWQSGEGTDLLLRGMRQRLPINYVPEYILFEAPSDPPTLEERRRRLRLYGRGTGRVYARNYSRMTCSLLLVKSMARVVLQTPRGMSTTLDNWEVLRGRIEGVVGRPIWD